MKIPRGIGKHNQVIKILLARRSILRLVELLLFPSLLPFFLYFLRLVIIHSKLIIDEKRTSFKELTKREKVLSFNQEVILMSKKCPRLEDLPGVFLVAVWFPSLSKTATPSFAYFLVEGKNEERAQKLIKRYLTERGSAKRKQPLSIFRCCSGYLFPTYPPRISNFLNNKLQIKRGVPLSFLLRRGKIRTIRLY